MYFNRGQMKMRCFRCKIFFLFPGHKIVVTGMWMEMAAN